MEKLKGALLLAAMLLAAGPVSAEVAGPKVNWRFATMGSPRAATTHLEEIKKHVEKQTNGRFSITVGYGTFGDSKEFLDLLKIGSVHGATVQASVSVDRLPLYTGLDLPFLPIETFEAQRKVHDAFHKLPAILKEFEAWNAVPFMSSLLPTYELMGSGPTLKRLADIKGMRIRALGGNGNALAKLGAVPSNMPPQEMYVAFERGLLTAVALPYYAHVSYRTYELGKWMTTNMGLAGTALPLVLNLKAWNELTPEYRALLEEAREIAYQAQAKAMERDEESALEKIKSSKMELIQIDANELAELRKVGAEPVWQEWIKAQNARKLPADDVLDFIMKQAAAAKGSKS